MLSGKSAANRQESSHPPRVIDKAYQSGSNTMAGYGSWARTSPSSASRRGSSSPMAPGESRSGGYPACRSAALQSEIGASSSSIQASSRLRLGRARAISTKLRCLCEIPRRSASSNCDTPACLRMALSSSASLVGCSPPSISTIRVPTATPPTHELEKYWAGYQHLLLPIR